MKIKKMLQVLSHLLSVWKAMFDLMTKDIHTGIAATN
jgi:hypothetical protein